MLLLEGRHDGAFNIAGDGTITIGECGDAIGCQAAQGPAQAGVAARRGDVEAARSRRRRPATSTSRSTRGWCPPRS